MSLTRMHEVLPVALEAIKFREEELNGKRYFVAPVVLLVEGVHVGLSGKRVYYSKEAIENVRSVWNGAPLVLQHPLKNGMLVSANDPTVLAAQGIGRVFNVSAKGGKLKGEAWHEIEKTEQLAPGLIEAYQNDIQMEISTGLYQDLQVESGEFDGVQYDFVSNNFVLDHLALVPGYVGACSYKKGCGIRANRGNETAADKEHAMADKKKDVDYTKQQIHSDSDNPNAPNDMWPRTMVSRVLAWLSSLMSSNASEMSHDEIRDAIRAKLNETVAEKQQAWPMEVYDDYVIYEIDTFGEPSVGGGVDLFKRDYSIDDKGNVTLGSEVIKVEREISYVPVTEGNVADTSTGTNDDKEVVVETKEMVDGLIACEKTKFTEEDREQLMALNMCLLQKLSAPESPPTEPKADPPAPAPAANQEADPPVPAKPATFAEVLASATPEVQAMVNRGLLRDKKEKDQLIANIKANERSEFTDGWLASRTIEELQGIAKFGNIAVTANYSGQLGGVPAKPRETKKMVFPKVWTEEQIAGIKPEATPTA